MALVAVLTAAVRLQYAPIALLLLGVFFFRTEKKVHLAVAAGVFLLAVGVFDALTWDGGLFHSYIANIRFNLIVDQGRAGETPGYQFLWWLLLASVGLGALSMVIALRDLRRYGFLLVLIGLVLLIHSVSAHKEYRFVFAVVPLWLVIGADVVARFGVRVWGLAGVLFAAISIGGVLNALPSQDQVYRAFSKETGKVGSSAVKIRFLPRIAIWPARPVFWACGRLTGPILTCLAITICTGRFRFTMLFQGVL